jgi:hypothetical protein
MADPSAVAFFRRGLTPPARLPLRSPSIPWEGRQPHRKRGPATQDMRSTRWPACCLAGVGLALAALSGCQTWTSGMTLPSPRYLEHPPQYFPPSPPFPLPRELAAQEAAAATAVIGPEAPPGPAAPLPPPVPGAGAPQGEGAQGPLAPPPPG